ncbi:modifier of protein aggregation 4 [Macrobrachium rosenbergii]|uniref:modifier of protein aggregation 4 n=1 Tax=Macrobrachium rosenbergii TaxID=79674 RepID=UPI0034D50A3A
MTRGNQRELARAKNAKKQQENKKGQSSSQKDGNKGMTLEARKHRDAEMMRLKQQKAAKKDGGAPSAN